ncbi:MAG TPA: SdpI family protein [Longimicrobiales bacterium]|nr:SdpI family protein [Longimicrobiales bacterium]
MNRKWLGPLLIAVAAVATSFIYARLPDQVPTHWNFRGEIDDWGPRFPYAYFGPLMGAALWILLPVLRRIDPRRRNYERFDETFWVLLNVLTIGMLGLHALTLGVALGYTVNASRAMLFGLGLMFAALGNYLPRLRSNWWMGIRTPWTLESEAVWRSTHRVGGRTFVAGGLVCMAAAFLPWVVAPWLSIAALGGASLVPVVYSYVLWRREREQPART